MTDQCNLPELGEVLHILKEQVLCDATPSGTGPITIPYNGTVISCGLRYRFKCAFEISVEHDSFSSLPSLEHKLGELGKQIETAAAPSGIGSLSVTHDILVGHSGVPYRLKATVALGSPNGARPIFAPEEFEGALA